MPSVTWSFIGFRLDFFTGYPHGFMRRLLLCLTVWRDNGGAKAEGARRQSGCGRQLAFGLSLGLVLLVARTGRCSLLTPVLWVGGGGGNSGRQN